MNDLYLIDGMALAYRGHFAFIRNPLRNKKGFPTSAVYSFLTTLRRILDTDGATQVVVAFDSDRETFRKTLYSEYKAHRPPMPDELRMQIPVIEKLLTTLAIPLIKVPGIEADDIIGTLAVKQCKAGGRSFIVSKDKDFGQLVNENIFLIDPKLQDGEAPRLGAAEVEAKFGIPPSSIIDYLALLGDASDNVPGVPKVGDKTAVDLIKRFSTLDGIYDHLNDIPQKALKKSLEENKELAYLSKELVTIKIDAELPEHTLAIGTPDSSAYREFLMEMDFHQFLKSPSAKATEATNETDYKTISTEEALVTFLSDHKECLVVGLDTETDGLDPLTVPIAGISLSTAAGTGVYIPIAHVDGENCPLDAVKKHLIPFLNRPDCVKVGHNLKFDLAVLNHHDLPVAPPFFDTLLAAYLLKPGERQLGLDDCVLERFQITMQQITDLIGTKKAEQIVFSQVNIAAATAYSAADADMALRLYTPFKKELEEQSLWTLFTDMEMPLMLVLLEMEKQGIRIDRAFLEILSYDYEKKLAEIHDAIVKEAGHEFNLNSPKQLQEVLFNELGIKPGRKNKTGFSTDSAVLEELASLHPVPRLILQHRKFQKLKSTYVDTLPLWADEKDRVHSSFNQAITATGRLSSSEPNLQNIPIRSDEGKELRKAFIPGSADRILISGDYSQIELRVLAHVANEEVLIEAFHEGEDIHRKTAALVFGIMPSLITPEQRGMAKTVNFGIVYGQGAYGLSQQLGISPKEAQKFIDGYFATYPRIRHYMDATIRFAQEKGYVETLFGRRRTLPDINSPNHQIKSFAERTAINTPIQGSAADLIKVAMVRIGNKIAAGLIPADMLLQVHDELVLECDASKAETVISLVQYEMEHVAELKVPLKVDIGRGNNWLEAHG